MLICEEQRVKIPKFILWTRGSFLDNLISWQTPLMSPPPKFVLRFQDKFILTSFSFLWTKLWLFFFFSKKVALEHNFWPFGWRDVTGLINVNLHLSGGKRDDRLILPVNSSLSATLHQKEVQFSAEIKVHHFLLAAPCRDWRCTTHLS